MLDGAVPNYRVAECCGSCKYAENVGVGYESDYYVCQRTPPERKPLIEKYKSKHAYLRWEATEARMLCDLYEREE